jgi:integrase
VDGGTDQRYFYFQTRGEALKAKEKIARELKRQQSITLVEAVERYLYIELRGVRRVRESTIDEARARLNPLIRLAPNLLSEVKPAHIHERLGQLAAAASQRGTLGRMSDFFGYVVEEGLIEANPCDGIVIKARPKRGKVTLTRAESRRLDACLWTEIEADGPDAQVASAIVLLLYLGLRRGEVLRLQARDIDGAIVSIERVAKTRRAFRDIEVTPKIAALLAKLVEGRELADWLWPSPKAASGHRGPTWLLKGTKRMCRKAGVAVVCPQGLRGTHGKLARVAGMTTRAVQAQLGHEDARTSVESYIGAAEDQRQSTLVVQRTLTTFETKSS